MATKPKANDQMTGRSHMTHHSSGEAAPHLSDRDVDLLRPYLQRLTLEIHADYGSPNFPHKVRELTSAIRQEIDPSERIESTNGYVALYEAEDTLILETLEKLARTRIMELLDDLTRRLRKPGGRAYPSDCDLVERNALVHGALVTFNCRLTGKGDRTLR